MQVRGRNKYFGGVLAPSGTVIFVPWHAAQVFFSPFITFEPKVE